MSDPERKNIIGRRYSELREAREPGWSSGPSYKRKAAAFDGVVERYGIPSGGRVLELGCGAGNTAIHMAKQGFRSFGIDMIPQAIKWAKHNAAKENVEATFRLGCVTELSAFGDSFFDLIFDGDCLWMVTGEDREKCFESVLRTLKPAGVFYAQAKLADPAFKERYNVSPDIWFDPVTGIYHTNSLPMYQFSAEAGFRKEIDSAGFELLRTGPIVFEDSDKTDKDDKLPFACGGMFIEARKPG